MKNEKGFIHIAEMIIISIVVLLLLMQFSSVQMPKSDWSRTKLVLMGYDILFGAEKMVDWTKPDYKSQLDEAVKKFSIPGNINFFAQKVKNRVRRLDFVGHA